MPLKKITLTFKDHNINDIKGFFILATRVARYKKYFKTIVFYPEVGQVGTFHFHGIIEYIKLYEVKFRSFIGNWRRYIGITKISDPCEKFAKVDPIHKVKWLLYCQKDQAQWAFRRIHKLNYKQYLKDHKYYKLYICDRCTCPKESTVRQTRSILDWYKETLVYEAPAAGDVERK